MSFFASLGGGCKFFYKFKRKVSFFGGGSNFFTS